MNKPTSTQSAPDPEAPQTTTNQVSSPGGRKRRGLLIAVIVVVLLGGGAGAFMLTRDNRKEPEANNQPTSSLDQNDPFVAQYLQNCKEREVAFTHSPVAIDQMSHFVPMGQMMDGHVTPTDHVYLNTKAAAETTDVVLPADGVVINVAAMPAQYVGDRNMQTAVEDHRIVVAHNCRYVSIFIHVHKLSPELAAAVGGKLEPNANKQLNLDLKAGAAIGKMGQSVDWTLADAKTKLTGFITPKLYENESWKIHTIDPVGVYAGTIKEQMIAASLRTVEPFGGKIDYDKPGALVGNWFREGTNGYSGASQERYWDGHLSIVPNHIDHTATVVSLGSWQGKAAQFTAKAAADPATITKASGPTKYELIDLSMLQPNGQPSFTPTMVKGMKASQTGPTRGTVLVEVMDGEKLKVELFPGRAPAQVTGFTSAAQAYAR